jgi:YHS domain-containing protein
MYSNPGPRLVTFLTVTRPPAPHPPVHSAEEDTMSQTTDPVCGATLDHETAAAQVTHGTAQVYFCSHECRRAFQADPDSYPLERHEPPFTVSKHFVAPKFGAAGSGGLEYEPGPERHEDD